jgi:hypothetical protein
MDKACQHVARAVLLTSCVCRHCAPQSYAASRRRALVGAVECAECLGPEWRLLARTERHNGLGGSTPPVNKRRWRMLGRGRRRLFIEPSSVAPPPHTKNAANMGFEPGAVPKSVSYGAATIVSYHVQGSLWRPFGQHLCMISVRGHAP